MKKLSEKYQAVSFEPHRIASKHFSENPSITVSLHNRYPLFDDAGRAVIDRDNAAIDMLQRTLKIGFNRASRLMEQLYECGVVGEYAITYAIQCKCYSSNIGNSAVQQAHTGKSLYRRDVAVVMTNQYFTRQAKEEVATLRVKLWDRDKLNSLIESAPQ